MLEVLKTTPRLGDLLGGFMNSAYSYTDGYNILQQKSQSKVSLGEGSWGEDQRKPGTSFPEPSPVEAHSISLIPSAMSWDM